MSQKSKSKIQQERKQLYDEVVDAFGRKYSWLGAQTARELLLSAASYNINQYSNPPTRYRNHVMLAWKRGWIKSTLLGKMATILGDDMCSTVGKVTEAAMRGSVSQGTFTPPKPLKTPIVISTEFGQTDFNDELLNIFLALLEEGKTNISLNKIGSMPENQKRQIENRDDFSGSIEFGERNEYDLMTDFVFWGATYDPSTLSDDALRSRFNVLTPSKDLDTDIVKALDTEPSVLSQIDKTTVRDIRKELKREKEMPTDFSPPESLMDEYAFKPRDLRDVKAYMACRNWWGLKVNIDVMENYVKHLKKSRRISTMEPIDRVMDIIFDNPCTYEEIQNKTKLSKQEIYTILEKLDAKPTPTQDGTKYAVYSGANHPDREREKSNVEEMVEMEKEKDGFLDNV